VIKRKSANIWWNLAPYALLFITVFLAFGRALANGFIWDDDNYIENNVPLRAFGGLLRIWRDVIHRHAEPQYYPLTHTTLWLNYHIWGLNPFGYHLDNLLLHAASAILLWRILRSLSVPGAFFAAMLFACHPVMAESVAWATERKNVLSGFFYFLSLLCYLQTIPEFQKKPGSDWLWRATSFLLFIAALLSKSVTASLPAAILLILWWRRGRIGIRDILPLIPFFITGIAMGLLTRYMEMYVVGAIGPEFDWIKPLDRIAIAGRIIWFDLYKLILPVNLAFIYPKWNVDANDHLGQLGFSMAIILVISSLWLLRKRIGRGPLAAILFFVGTLFPALGFSNVFPMRYSYVADHFQYLAAIGPMVLFAAGIKKLLERFTHGQDARATGVPAIICVALCVTSFLHTRIYADRMTLWTDTLAKNPNSAMAHLNLAATLRTDGKFDLAENEYLDALRLQPGAPAIWEQMGDLHTLRGDYPNAIQWYRKSLEHMPDSPIPLLHQIRGQPYYSMGSAYQNWADAIAAEHGPSADIQKYRDLAVQAYEQAIAIIPDYELAIVNLGVVFDYEGHTQEAMQQFHKALQINPDSVTAHNNLGNTLLNSGNVDGAIAEYQAALAINPEDAKALNNLGSVYGRQHQWDNAIRLFTAALNANPKFALARTNLRNALIAKNNSR
jgi:tetratricopeptide (TPR) repeat protein